MNERSSEKINEIKELIRRFDEMENHASQIISSEKERWFQRGAEELMEKFYADEMLKATEEEIVYMASEVIKKLAHDTSETLTIAIESGMFNE